MKAQVQCICGLKDVYICLCIYIYICMPPKLSPCGSVWRRAWRRKKKWLNMCSTLHSISQWFDHGYYVILSHSVNRCVKASQAQTRLHHSNWHLERSSPGLRSFKPPRSFLKTHRKVSQSTMNGERSLDGHWREKTRVYGCVSVLGGFSIADYVWMDWVCLSVNFDSYPLCWTSMHRPTL